MGDLHLYPICGECGRRHSSIAFCTWQGPAAKDDPNDPEFVDAPELTQGMLDRARPASEAHGAERAAKMIRTDGTTCKGSIKLGTGCGRCSRCAEEQAELILPANILKRELAVYWDWAEIDGQVCVGMAGNLDTVHDATLIISGGFLHTYEGNGAARLLAAHLVNQHNAAIDGRIGV